MLKALVYFCFFWSGICDPTAFIFICNSSLTCRKAKNTIAQSCHELQCPAIILSTVKLDDRMCSRDYMNRCQSESCYFQNIFYRQQVHLYIHFIVNIGKATCLNYSHRLDSMVEGQLVMCWYQLVFVKPFYNRDKRQYKS